MTYLSTEADNMHASDHSPQTRGG